jgi:hypothetical protein
VFLSLSLHLDVSHSEVGILSVFFAPARYRVVKITHSYSEVVLWTTKHTIVYRSSGPSVEVIALRPKVWYWRWSVVTTGWAECSRILLSERGKCSCVTCQKGRGPFIDREAIGLIQANYFYILKGIYMTSGAQTWDSWFVDVGCRFPRCSRQFQTLLLPSWVFSSALGHYWRRGGWRPRWFLERLLHDVFTWWLSLPTWGVEVNRLAYPLHRPTAHIY